MRKSGLADSPFFSPPQPGSKQPVVPLPDQAVSKQKSQGKVPVKKTQTAERQSHRDTTAPRHHDTTVARYHDVIIETVRKAVKAFGKEAATHRFTPEEKRALADLIHAYRGRGVKTSENQIARIAVNFVIDDYRQHGEHSLLDRVLKALHE
jgi:hypothetical protein